MLKQNQILDESKKILRKKSKEVVFPVDKKTLKLLDDMVLYLRKSQDDDYAEKNNIRGGMGLAGIQLGIEKRFFAISYKREDGSYDEYKIINPKLVSHSEELIYVEEGEGCLSVNRPIEGIIPRYARVTIEYQDGNGDVNTVRVREEIAVAFQHEIDHLNGILFVDRIDKNKPYKNKEKMRAI